MDRLKRNEYKKQYLKNFQFFDLDLKFRKWNKIKDTADWKYGLHGEPLYDNDIAILTSHTSINQSLKNILLTQIFERPFDVEFGGGLYHLLFENMFNDVIIQNSVKSKLITLIYKYESRVDVMDILFNTNKYDISNSIINITVIYKIPSTINVSEVTFSIERIK